MGKAVAGVFIAYFREDQRLARRVRNALVSLGVDVIWDEEMPGGVPWREWIADNIDSLAAVMVLWTPGSITRPNVHEEAMEGVKGKKLISVMHGIDQPPLGYGKDNISRLDSWEAGKLDSGWKSFVAEIDSKIATSKGQRPGSLIAIYTSQLEEVRKRKADLAVSEREGKQRLTQRTKLAKACQKAEQQVERDEKSLADVQGAQMAAKPKMAAMKAAHEELEYAREQHGAALQRLEEFDDVSEQADLELEYKRKNLDEYLVFIGGSGEGSGSFVPPLPQEPALLPLSIDPLEGLQEPQTELEQEEAKSDDVQENPEPPIEIVHVKPVTSTRPTALYGILERLKSGFEARTRRVGLLVGLVLALGLAWQLFITPQADERRSEPEPEKVAPKEDTAPSEPKTSLSFVEERRQKLAWLLDPKWGGKDGCRSAPNMYLLFDLTKVGEVLSMRVNRIEESDRIEKIGPGESVTTATQIIMKSGSRLMTAIDKEGGTKTRFEKCAR